MYWFISVFLKHPFSKSFFFFVVVLFFLFVFFSLSFFFVSLVHIPSESVPTLLQSGRESPTRWRSSGRSGLCLSRGVSRVLRAIPPAGSVGINGRALEGLAEFEVTVEGEGGVWL